VTAFTGMRVLVTGGASGIGLTTARRLAAEGAAVAVLDLVLLAEAERAGLISVQGDVTDDASVRAAVHGTATELGGLDVLVNNAGIGTQGGIEDNPDDEWHRVLDVNVVGTVR
jgi:NAD(P)-dependent dehydrogenase (short-subunit alcohol dehydrogenase family)